MELKYLVPIIFLLVAAVGALNYVYASPTPTPVAPTFSNNSYWNQTWLYVNITVDENTTDAYVNFTDVEGASIIHNMTNTSGNDGPWLQFNVNMSNLNNTKAGIPLNYSIVLKNTSGTTSITGLYYMYIDNTTPTVALQALNKAPGGFTIINSSNCTYGCTRENIALLTATITDNTTHTCLFRLWYENMTSNYPGYPTMAWTLSTTNYTGTLGGAATDQERNCTFNLTGTEIAKFVTDGVIKIEAWANDSVGFEATSSSNLTFIFNTLPSAKWKLLGNTEAATDLAAFAHKASTGNISFMSLFNNTWDNKSYITYTYGAAANSDVSFDAGNFSAGWVYSPSGWYLIRSNTSLGDPVFLYGANTLINDTKKGCAAGDCDYEMTLTPMVNDVTLNVTNGTEQLFGVTVNVSNATLTNITIANISPNNITFYYEWDNARSPWNLVGCVATNSTAGLAAQSANITYVSYYNSTLGYHLTYKKDFNFNENITINRGEAMWVLSTVNSSTDVVQINSSLPDIRSPIGLISVEWIR